MDQRTDGRDMTLTELWLASASRRRVAKALKYPDYYREYILPRLRKTPWGSGYAAVVRVTKDPFTITIS